MKKIKTAERESKIIKQGEEMKIEKCPNCKQELIVEMKDGTEVFVCDNCKFVKRK